MLDLDPDLNLDFFFGADAVHLASWPTPPSAQTASLQAVVSASRPQVELIPIHPFRRHQSTRRKTSQNPPPIRAVSRAVGSWHRRVISRRERSLSRAILAIVRISLLLFTRIHEMQSEHYRHYSCLRRCNNNKNNGFSLWCNFLIRFCCMMVSWMTTGQSRLHIQTNFEIFISNFWATRGFPLVKKYY